MQLLQGDVELSAKRKRSVADIVDFWPPARILELCRLAYSEEYVRDSDRLEHAAVVSGIYLPGFRVNEALQLTKSQFQWRTSLEGELTLVIEGVSVEKSGGRVRNFPIWPGDPIARPLLAHLASVEDDMDFVFRVTDRTVLNILDRITGGVAWTHWLRAQRNTFLAVAFTRDERNRILGWSAPRRWSAKGAKGKGFGSMADRYDSMNWMSYADRLAKLTRSYWQNQQMSPETRSWLDSLPPSLKAPDAAPAAL